MEKLKKSIKAFSLIELMIFLITVASISAAFAPVISKKIKSSNVLARQGEKTEGIKFFDCSNFKEEGEETSKCILCGEDKCFVCTKICASDEYKNPFDCKCYKCNGTDANCTGSCIFNKNVNNPGSICKSCSKGYYTDNEGACQVCEKGYKCPGGIEIACDPTKGEYQDETGQTSCKSCRDTNNCDECYSKDSDRCKTCFPGYELNNGSCVSCGIEGCTHYSSGCTCDACADGYKLNDGSCEYCRTVEGCTEYSGCTCTACDNPSYQLFSMDWKEPTCVACEDLYCLRYPSTQQYAASYMFAYCRNCEECAPGYYHGAQQCYECETAYSYHCASYSVECACEECLPNSEFDSNHKCQCKHDDPYCYSYLNDCSCRGCNSPAILDNGVCINCEELVPNCSDFSYGTCNCRKCASGFGLIGDECVNCEEPNCSTYVSNNSCDCSTCKSGYKKYNNHCVVCSDVFPNGCLRWDNGMSTCYCNKPAYGWISGGSTGYVPRSCGEFHIQYLTTAYRMVKKVCTETTFWAFTSSSDCRGEQGKGTRIYFSTFYQYSTCTGASEYMNGWTLVPGQGETWNLDDLLDPMMGED